MYDPNHLREGKRPEPPNPRSLLVALTCVAVIGAAAYFVIMDRSDRAAQAKVNAACDRDRNYVSTMTALGSRDATVAAARQRAANC